MISQRQILDTQVEMELLGLWQYGSGITGYYALVLQANSRPAPTSTSCPRCASWPPATPSPADSTVTDLEFGWEICSTNHVPLNFTLTNYAVWTGLK